MRQDFKAFLTKSNAIALAVGVSIGAATGKAVSSLVDDLIMPVVSLLLPSGSWKGAKIVLKTFTDAQGKVTESALQNGRFLGTVVDLLIIAIVVFVITKMLLKPAPEVPAPATKTCPQCLESVPEAAKKCRACATVFG